MSAVLISANAGSMENEVVEEVVGRAELQYCTTRKDLQVKLKGCRSADVYFEIYLASRRMTHDLVKLIYHLVVVLPKQLTLSLNSAGKTPKHIIVAHRTHADQRTAVRCRVVVDFSPTPTTPHANEQRPVDHLTRRAASSGRCARAKSQAASLGVRTGLVW